MHTTSITPKFTTLLDLLESQHVAWGFYMHEENGEESERIKLTNIPSDYFYRDEDVNGKAVYCLGFIPQSLVA
jgi:hypothetical protein